MEKIKLKSFSSPADFIIKFLGLFKGTTFIMTFLKTDRKFAEKIFLTVAMRNNCYG